MAKVPTEVRLLIKAEDSQPLAVFIEPWADEFTISQGESVVVTFVGSPPEGHPHATLEWQQWGLTVWAEIGMLERTITARDGTVLIETAPELVRLLGIAEHATFGYPADDGQPGDEVAERRSHRRRLAWLRRGS